MLQTKLAFKIDEIKRRAQNESNNSADSDEKKQNEPIAETKATDDVENDNEEEEETQDINPFFREPLYVGNLCLASSGDRYYRWILFVSTSNTEIVKPKSISSVTYMLHPTHKNPKRIQTNSPFFLDINGWGIFQVDIQINFKHNFIRPSIETAHMLSIDAPAAITCIEDGSREYHDTLFKYQHFKAFKNEKHVGKVSFVKKAKHRLQRNLLKTPAPIYFEGFHSTLSKFKSMLKHCIAKEETLQYLHVLHIPDIIYDMIGYFAVFAQSLFNIMPNQEVYIEECHDSDIVISAPKFNHLRLRRCTNITISFPYIMSKCELIECDNVKVICTGLCYTFRMDTSDNINIEFLDPGSRATFLCFSTPHVTLKCIGIQWQTLRPKKDMNDSKANDEYLNDLSEYNDREKYPDTWLYNVPYDKDVKDRISVRWRTDYKTPQWSWRVFHARHVLGSSSAN